MENLTITFGKHTGRTIAEIALSDINWLIWFTKNYDPYYSQSGWRVGQATINKKLNLLSAAKAKVSEYFDSIAKRNKENSTSEFFGTLKKRIKDLKLTITKTQYEGVIAETADGNKIKLYISAELGEEITIDGTPTKHYEQMGHKITYMNRIKIK